MTELNGESRSLVWAVASLPFPGEQCSGDAHFIAPVPAGTLAAVIDGLGHGPEAHAAAKAAISTMEQAATLSPVALLMRCHEKLVGTRGVVMTVALISDDGDMTWAGVGNVEGGVVRHEAGAPRETVLLRRGVVGWGSLASPHTASVSLSPGDLVVLATDGIRDGFLTSVDPMQSPGVVAARVLADHARGYDDALVLVLQYQGSGRDDS